MIAALLVGLASAAEGGSPPETAEATEAARAAAAGPEEAQPDEARPGVVPTATPAGSLALIVALATELRVEGHGREAWLEYRRAALATNGDPTLSSTFRWHAGEALHRDGAWADAAQDFGYGGVTAPVALRPAFRVAEAESRYRLGDLDDADRLLAAPLKTGPPFWREPPLERLPDALADAIAYRRAWIALRQGDRETATQRLAEVDTAPFAVPAAELSRAVAARPTPPYRSPGLAGALSAVVPGTGQIYAGAPLDGLGAFFVVGLCAGGTVLLAREGETGAAVGLGLLGATLWSGNVLSANQAAHRANRRALRRDLDAWAPWEADLGSGPYGSVLVPAGTELP